MGQGKLAQVIPQALKDPGLNRAVRDVLVFELWSRP